MSINFDTLKQNEAEMQQEAQNAQKQLQEEFDKCIAGYACDDSRRAFGVSSFMDLMGKKFIFTYIDECGKRNIVVGQVEKISLNPAEPKLLSIVTNIGVLWPPYGKKYWRRITEKSNNEGAVLFQDSRYYKE